jgi:hypothetical protein
LASRAGFRAALALTLAAGILAAPGPGAGGDAPDASPPAKDRGAQPVPRPPDHDEEIVEHLDEIEKLELLENLELFDPAAEQERR